MCEVGQCLQPSEVDTVETQPVLLGMAHPKVRLGRMYVQEVHSVCHVEPWSPLVVFEWYPWLCHPDLSDLD